jgi:hypothetical protein
MARSNPGAPRCRRIWTRAWGRIELADKRTGRWRAPADVRECSRVGWASDATTTHEAHEPRSPGHRRDERWSGGIPCLAASGAGRVGRFIFHAIAISTDDKRLPMMHQPVDQGCGQRVVDIKQGAPFSEGSIRV